MAQCKLGASLPLPRPLPPSLVNTSPISNHVLFLSLERPPEENLKYDNVYKNEIRL